MDIGSYYEPARGDVCKPAAGYVRATTGKLPRCMIVDANESTNVMLKLQERRKLEDGTR
jgi:hypothetical protein